MVGRRLRTQTVQRLQTDQERSRNDLKVPAFPVRSRTGMRHLLNDTLAGTGKNSEFGIRSSESGIHDESWEFEVGSRNSAFAGNCVGGGESQRRGETRPMPQNEVARTRRADASVRPRHGRGWFASMAGGCQRGAVGFGWRRRLGCGGILPSMEVESVLQTGFALACIYKPDPSGERVPSFST